MYRLELLLLCALFLAPAWLAPRVAVAVPRGIQTLALQDAPVPNGPPNAIFNLIGFPGIDDVGPYFSANYNTTENPADARVALFATDPEDGSLYRRLDTSIISSFQWNSSSYEMSRASQLIVPCGGVSVGNARQAVCVENAKGGFDFYAQELTEAPSVATPEAEFQDSHFGLMITPNGEFAFGNQLRWNTGDPPVSNDTDRGVWWTVPNGELAITLQRGDPVPGVPNTVAYPNPIMLSDAGLLVNYGGGALYYPKVGDPWVVVGQGLALPDDPLDTTENAATPVQNGSGELAFAAEGEETGWHLYGPGDQGGIERWVSEGRHRRGLRRRLDLRRLHRQPRDRHRHQRVGRSPVHRDAREPEARRHPGVPLDRGRPG